VLADEVVSHAFSYFRPDHDQARRVLAECPAGRRPIRARMVTSSVVRTHSATANTRVDRRARR
jgi:hypothetical protein